MAGHDTGVDLGALGANVTPEWQDWWVEVVDDWQTEVDLDALGVTVETRWEQLDLRWRIDGAQALQEFEPHEIAELERFFQQYSPEINSVIFDIQGDIEAAADMSEAQLVTEIGSITLTWEFAEIWPDIQAEVARIHNLWDGEEIVIEAEEWEYVFESKREALLFLYAQKISAYRTQEFLNSLWSDEADSSYWPLIRFVLLAYVWFCVGWTVLRNVNHLAIRLSNGWIGSWSYISVASSWSEWSEAVGTWEAQKRREAAQLLDYVFQGDGSINSGRLPDINVLDHSIVVWGNNIWGRRWEGTWWRQLQHLSRDRWAFNLRRMWELFLTPILFNREGSTIQYLQRQAEIKNTVLRQLFQTNPTQVGEQIQFTRLDIVPGSEWTMVRNFRAFMDLSHEIWNEDEARIRDSLDEFMRSLENGDLDFISQARNIDEALREVQHRLLEIATGDRWSDADLERIFGDGTNQNPGEWVRLLGDEVREWLVQMRNYDEIITARSIDARIQWNTYNERQVRVELQEFFDSVWNEPGQHRYNFKTASLIIEWILNGETKDEAIARVFWLPWADVNTTVTDRRYLPNQNISFIEWIEREIIVRAQDIWSLEELRNFERQVMDQLVDHDSSPRNQLWERLIRELNAILEEKRAAWLPDTRPTPTPAPGESDADRFPHYHPDAIDEALRAQAVFDDAGAMTEDARLLFQANVQLHILNWNERNLGFDQISNFETDYRWNVENIWDLLRDLSSLNEENTITDMTNAQAVILQSRRYWAQDLVERSLLQADVFTENTSIDVELRGSRIVVTVQENWVLAYDFAWESITELETQIRADLWIEWDIRNWWDIDLDSFSSRWINIDRFWQYSILHSIDNFFRRAR